MAVCCSTNTIGFPKKEAVLDGITVVLADLGETLEQGKLYSTILLVCFCFAFLFFGRLDFVAMQSTCTLLSSGC